MNKFNKSKSQIKAEELADEVEQLGQEDEEKAVPLVIEKGKEEQSQKDKEFNDTLQFFDEKRNSVKTYTTLLAQLANNVLKSYIDWPPKFDFKVTHSIRGVGVVIKDPLKRMYARGFKPTGEAKFDLHAVKTLVWQAENTIEEFIKEQELWASKAKKN